MQNCSSSGEFGNVPKVLNKPYVKTREIGDRMRGERKEQYRYVTC